jgi:acetyltransferase-like isoleucine patch superfamily enzyme
MNPEFTLPETEPGTLVPLEALRRVLKSCGRDVKVYRGCRLVPPDRIQIGDRSQIDESVRIYAGEGVELGRHVHLAFLSSISGGGSCVIGDFVGIGAGVRILTGSEEIEGGLTNPTIPPEFRRVRRARTVIGAHALIFTNSIVLPGVTIGEGAVVAAGSVVHRDVPPWSILAGNPLVRIGTRDPEPLLAAAAQLLRS